MRNLLRDLRHFLEFAAIWPFVLLIGLLDEADALALGRWGGRVAWRLLRNERRTVERHLAVAFGDGMTDRQRRDLCRQVFENYGITGVEILRMDRRWIADRVRVAYSSPEFERWAKSGAARCWLVVTGHFGCFEAIVPGMKKDGWNGSLVGRSTGNPWIDAVIDRIRTRSGSRSIPRGPAGVRASVAWLRQPGGTAGLGIAVDVNAAQGGVCVPVLGATGMVPPGASVLAAKCGATPCLVTIARQADGRGHVITIGPPLPIVRGPDGRPDHVATMAGFVAAFDDAVRQRPADYHWLANRWKTRPDGTDWNGEGRPA